MGRKKIEIRPLTDERNRNVTFLKRKAGLMKKAWELSVLCGADVSILIFSNQGKAHEFSSKDLDSEIDKYLDYEGLIERRRAEEFAAMALAGEDDDDDEEDMPRRGSTSKNAGPNGAPAQTKSLKGKEVFKSRMPSREEVNRMLAKAKDGKRVKSKKRTRRREDGRGRSFIDEILTDEESSEAESDRGKPEDKRKRRREDGPDDGQPGMAGLSYALSMHQAPALPAPEAEQLSNYLGHGSGMPRPSSHRPIPFAHPHDAWQSQNLPQDPQYAYLGSHLGHPIPPPSNAMSGNMQWNQELLSRYAEFQLQQSHQKQQRALLERQRAQMADLGIPVDDRGLLDQIFGAPSSAPTQHQSHVVSPNQDLGSGSSATAEPFEWPTVNGRHREETSKEPYAYPGYADGGVEYKHTEGDGIPWGVGGEGGSAGSIPPSRREQSYNAMLEDRRRLNVPL